MPRSYLINRQLAKKPIALAISAALLGFTALPAIAVEKKIDDKDVEVIEVVGIRGGIITAQEIKRNANTVKDVISADDIGALPDKSVTEALMRVPGVTIERFAASDDPNHFAAEGTGVVIRGLKRVRSEINGRDSFSASTGGGLSYADVPGELLGSIEVVKNVTADLIAGGIAGSVNLVTRKPFDSPDMVLTGTLKGSYGDHSEEQTPVFSGIFSDRWETNIGEFGLLLAGSSSEYKDKGDGVALGNYYERSATAREMPQFGDWGTELENYSGQTKYVPNDVTIRTADSQRERTGLASTLQYRSPDNSLEITAEYLKSNATLSWDERVVQQGEQGFNVNPTQNDVINATFDDNGFMTAGTLAMKNRSIAQSRWRYTDTDVEDTSLHLTYHATDMLSFDFDIQHVESTFEVNDYTISSSFANNDASFTTHGDSPTVDFIGENLTTPLPPIDGAAEVYIASAMDKEDYVDAESNSFAADLEYQIEGDWFTSIQAGAYISTKEQTKKDSSWNWGEAANGDWQSYADGGQHTAYQGTDAQPGQPDLYEQFTFNANDFHGGGVLSRDQSFLFPTLASLHDWKNHHSQGLTNFVPLGKRSCLTLSGECELDGSYLPSEISTTEEKRQEFYIKANFENDALAYPVRGNFGLRYVSWQVESTGASLFPVGVPGWDKNKQANYTTKELAFQNNLNGEQETVKGQEYTKLLPSFNLSVELDEDKIVRFAISENIFLPQFEDVRYFRKITESHVDPIGPAPYTDIAFDGTTGNPNSIEPEEALSIDLTYEWYISDSNSLTVSLFRKDLSNIIRKRLFTEDVVNEAAIGTTAGAWDYGWGQHPENVANPENADRPFTAEDVTFPVNFQTRTNIGSGTIQGFEFAYTQFFDFLPGVWSGLGLSANYTFVKQSDIDDSVGFGEGSGGAGGRNRFRAFKNLPLPGYSDDTINITAMYEKYDISARLAYNWRSEYLLHRRDADMFAPVYAEATGQLDASISYTITENVKVGLEATNLLNEVIKTRLMYNQQGDQTIRSHFKTDTRFGAYVTARF